MKLTLATAALAAAAPAGAQPHHGHGTPPPSSQASPAAGQSARPDAAQDMADMPGMASMAARAQGMNLAGALGPYPGSRESSGTAWQPDASPMGGAGIMSGGWMLMGHALL